MEQLLVGICEDDKEERVRLLDMVTEAAEKVKVEAFGSAEELLESYYPGKYDLIILDSCHGRRKARPYPQAGLFRRKACL